MRYGRERISSLVLCKMRPHFGSITKEMMMTETILILTTSHGDLGDTGRKTGFYWEELALPYWAFRDAGYAVAFASPKGGMPPADPGSAKAEGRVVLVQRFLDDAGAMAALAAGIPVDQIQVADYTAVFLPGGHGTMWDMAQTPGVGRLVGRMYESGAIVGAVCHGPAGLMEARLADGTPIVQGRRVNSFTNAEEVAAGLDRIVPYLMETRLRGLGALFEGNAANFTPYAVRDGNLITGQNPASSAGVADLMLQALSEKAG
jgi:putative intracellular protease/amidase